MNADFSPRIEAIISTVIDALLLANGQIAHIFSIHHVLEKRPDLTDSQAWRVLQFLDRTKDSYTGITWEHVDKACYRLYGHPPRDES